LAQEKFVSQSLSLASTLVASLGEDHLPALSAHAPVRPLDNLMCPAIAVEVAPLRSANGDSTPPADAAYQQQLATALTNALRAWRDQNHPQASAVPNLDSQTAAQSMAIAAAEAAVRAAARGHTPTAASVQPAPAVKVQP
jgi:N-acetylmuramoyl-L-alanine amidase